jgi:hypothetical protein
MLRLQAEFANEPFAMFGEPESRGEVSVLTATAGAFAQAVRLFRNGRHAVHELV